MEEWVGHGSGLRTGVITISQVWDELIIQKQCYNTHAEFNLVLLRSLT